ncbi:MAG: hypothetical protein HXY30_19705 [Pseudorhodoplanes sp.]|nr:hypothetical protein [Pseudorhodoplanes sp.]
MTTRKDCIDEILEAIRDRKDRRYVEDHLEELDRRFDNDDGPGTAREKYFRAAKEMLEEQAERAAILKRNMRMDAVKLRDLRTFLEAAKAAKGGSYQLGLEARLVGVNRPFFDEKSRAGNQASVGALSLGAQRDWIGGTITAIRKAERDDPKLAGLEQLFYSKTIEDEIFTEKIELEKKAKGRRDANPGVTKNAHAKAIAEILHETDKRKVAVLNSEGAWITEHSAFGASVMHDPDRMLAAAGGLRRKLTPEKMRKAAFRELWEDARRAWVAATLPRIDAKRMFGTEKDADKKLAEMFGGLVTGDHMKVQALPDEGYFNVAAKVSASREFVFKSARDQLAYMRQFGRFGATDAWLYGMRYAADKYAIMKVFGSEPKKGFDEILEYAKGRTKGTPERRALDKAERWLRTRYAVVSGEADIPLQNAWSGLAAGWMAVVRMAKLGLTPLSMLADNATMSRELAYQGLGVFERYSSLFSGYLRGADGSAKREVADLLHTGIFGRLRGATARFDIADGAPGILAKLENIFFRFTLISPLSENKRADAERLMARHFGKLRGKAFGELEAGERRIMQAFGIGEKEWELLGKAEWNEVGGDVYLTPDVALRIPDEAMNAHLGGTGSISERAAAAAANPVDVGAAGNALDRARKELALKLWAYYGERGQFAVIEVGAREKAILYQGTQSGSPLNLALRLLLQFKQFPTALLTKVYGRELFGGKTGLDRVAGVTEFVVVSTLLGMLANYLNDIAKGQDPNARWRNAPLSSVVQGFLRGGAGTIYGDFLIGEFSRHGLSALASLAGPTFGQIDKVAELWSSLTHPEKWKASAAALGVRTVRENTPFLNMIYTRAAFDYLIYWRLLEALNPGYLSRMEQTMKRNQGTEFLLRPSQVAR